MFKRIGREGGPGPFQFVILLFLTFGAVSTLTHLGSPTSLNRVLPYSLLVIWSIILVFGSFVGFIGTVWWGRETTALVIEQIGLIAIAGASLIYAVVLGSQLETIQGASVLTSFIGGFGIAALWRVVQIFKRQRQIVRISEQIDSHEDGDA